MLGSYWNSYLIDGLPENFLAFLREGAYIRNYRNLDQVLANQYFIIVANEWLNDFPAELYQHGINLKRLKVYPALDKIRYALYERTVK